MRLRNIPGSREAISVSRFCIGKPEEEKGGWNTVFQNENPIHIEIGMGKGKFLMELAKENPDIDYIGIEKYSSVLFRALEKLEKNPMENIRLIRFDAEHITDIFGAGEVERIYLNFSDPWPKDRHAKRRLTSREFLARYDKILSSEGWIEFKTDNELLFEFSLEEAKEAGWHLEGVSRNLHGDAEMNQGNIMTEYEERFSALGNPIYKMMMTH